MISKWFKSLSDHELKPSTMWLFERLLALWFLSMALVNLPVKDIFWGTESVFLSSHADGLLRNMFYLLAYNRWLDDLFFLAHFISALWIVFGRWTFVPKVVLYFTGFALYYAASFAYNGGFLLSLLLMFYSIFSFPFSRKWWAQVSGNMSLLACLLQVTLVYAVASTAKCAGTDWLEGSAFYYGIHLDLYAGEWVRDTLGNHKWLLILFSYFGFAYQLLFPILVWIRRSKHVFLLFGVLFHLGIVIVMGLYDFGTAMIVAYVLFIDEKLAKNIMSKLPKWWVPKQFYRLQQID